MPSWLACMTRQRRSRSVAWAGCRTSGEPTAAIRRCGGLSFSTDARPWPSSTSSESMTWSPPSRTSGGMRPRYGCPCGCRPGTVRVNQSRLWREMVSRGWRAADLAQAASVSPGTLTAVMQGRTVSPHTLRKLALALTSSPVVPGLEQLVDDEDI
ncbi:MAG: hypothetical protein DLM67_19100 [Candidatus Nephthysia bennettiae]|nr:MAG: hypothetical protein DLM67_19100 [Candidatus Dormibacteraeota bacterium]